MKAPGRATTATRELVKIPRPAGMLYTIEVCCLFFGRSRKAMYHLLTRVADQLEEPLYCQVGWPRDRKLYRVLSEQDVQVLRGLFPVYAKRRQEKSAPPL